MSNKKQNNKVLIYFMFFLRVTFGGLFVFSGILKLIDIQEFSKALANFALINDTLIPFVSYTIPIIEVLLGLAIIFKVKIEIMSQLAVYMLVVFTTVVIAKVVEGMKIECGCFGNLTNSVIGIDTIIRNIILILFGIGVSTYYSFSRSNKKLKDFFFRDLFKAALVFIFFSMAVQTLVFAYQNKTMKLMLAQIESRESPLSIGETAPVFSVTTHENTNDQIDFSTHEYTLVIIMSYNCGNCKKSIPVWNDLYNELSNEKLNFIAIANIPQEMCDSMQKENNTNFKINPILNKEFIDGYYSYITPQTILINKEGVVVKNWVGKFDPINKSMLMDYLN